VEQVDKQASQLERGIRSIVVKEYSMGVWGVIWADWWGDLGEIFVRTRYVASSKDVVESVKYVQKGDLSELVERLAQLAQLDPTQTT